MVTAHRPQPSAEGFFESEHNQHVPGFLRAYTATHPSPGFLRANTVNPSGFLRASTVNTNLTRVFESEHGNTNPHQGFLRAHMATKNPRPGFLRENTVNTRPTKGF